MRSTLTFPAAKAFLLGSLAGAPFFVHSVAWANDRASSCGVLEVVKGDVRILPKGVNTPQARKAGEQICAGETIISGADSRAKIVMADGNQLNVSPNSRIAIEVYEFKPAQNKKSVLLNVMAGKVRAATATEGMYADKAADGSPNQFRVKTKTAVAGVRGTDFLSGFNPSSNTSEFVTFKGLVEVGRPGPNGAILDPVSVAPGQRTEAVSGQAPTPPTQVPAGQFDELKVETQTSAPGSVAPESATADANAPSKDPAPASDTRAASPSDSAGSSQAGASTPDSSGSPPRAPAATSGPGQADGGRPAAGAPSLLSPGDLGKGKDAALPSLPRLNQPPAGLPSGALPPALVRNPAGNACEFCNQVINSGPTRLKIEVRLPADTN
jgi:hypothetical protein